MDSRGSAKNMINWQFSLLQSLLDNWDKTTENQYVPSEEELAALEWFMELSQLGEYDRLWFVQVAGTVGMKIEGLIQLTHIGQILLEGY
jgi:hypothetical protein